MDDLADESEMSQFKHAQGKIYAFLPYIFNEEIGNEIILIFINKKKYNSIKERK